MGSFVIFIIEAKKRTVITRAGKILSLSLAFFFLAYIIYSFAFFNKVTPHTYFAGQDASGKSGASVEQSVLRTIGGFSKNKFVFFVGNREIAATLDDLGIAYDKIETSKRIFDYSRSGEFLRDQAKKIGAIFFRRDVEPVFSVDDAKFNAFLNQEFGQIERISQNSTVIFAKGGAQILPSENGVVVDRVMLIADLNQRLKSFSKAPIALNYIQDLAQVDASSAQGALATAKSLSDQTIIFTYKYDHWPISAQDLFGLLKFTPENAGNNTVSLLFGKSQISVKRANVNVGDNKLVVKLDDEKVDALIVKIADSVDHPTVDATLQFDGTKVTEFTPAQDGLALDRQKTKQLFLEKISASDSGKQTSSTIELPVFVAHAKIANQAVNNLGIRELIGSGISYFAGSIPNRAFNISLGASLISGVIVKPGDVFSFNALVGPVSAEQGFKQAYIIKKDRTVLDDGGGICQVSTTVFRAALNAGLPIVKRTAHAYRVAYYEQRGFKPGFDATIFSPNVDFQFKNDTDKYILVQSKVDRANAKLQIDIYGTNDGRRVKISEPVISNVVPAPEPLRQDDPSLSKGVTKQVDFAAAGATSVFTRKVYKGDQLIIDETFRSNFRPWQAVYLVGTGG